MDFETLGFKPDKRRILSALKGEIPDKVPLFDNYIDDKIVEKILGCNAGNTCAAIGDPCRGDDRSIVGGDVCVPMDPKDFINLCNTICQDAIMLEHAFVPYGITSLNGKPAIINDGGIKNGKRHKKD